MICKYYGFQAIAEVCGKKENYENTLEKGKEYEVDGDDFCTKLLRLIDVVKQNHKDNERMIKGLFTDVSRKVPSFLVKMFNEKFMKQNIINNNDINEIKTNDSEEEDLK